MKVIGACGGVIIVGRPKEINKWKEGHPEYIHLPRNIFDSKYLYNRSINIDITDPYKKNTEEQCMRDTAVSIEVYAIYKK